MAHDNPKPTVVGFESRTFTDTRVVEYRYNKIISNKITATAQDPESLETFEALVSRFSRVTAIFAAKYLRALAEQDDPAFRGSLRDWVNYAEKRGVIQSAKMWMDIWELRNKISYEYATKDLSGVFKKMLANTPEVLCVRELLK